MAVDDSTGLEVSVAEGSGQVGAALTDELASEYLDRRRGEVRNGHRPWNTEASADAIRHFAHGIGDLNPLWCDRKYGENSKYGCVIAPPTFLYSFGTPFGGGLPQVHGMFGGSDFVFHEPIREGDGVRSTIELIDMVPLTGRYSGKMFKQLERMRYYNHDEVMVAEAHHWTLRTARDAARDRREQGTGRYDSRRSIQHYSQDAIAGIDSEYESEKRRGAEIRYLDDVRVGELIPPVVKGPLRITDIIGYIMGGGSPYVRAHATSYEFRKEHPDAYIPNEFGIPDVPERVHWEDQFAKAIGIPGAYDYGQERPSWIAHMLTNWAGDHGWVRRLRVELRGVNVVGDTTRCLGNVTDVVTGHDGDDDIAQIAVRARNQLGEITAKGHAEVILPVRD